MSSSQLLNLYFSGWLNHQPELLHPLHQLFVSHIANQNPYFNSQSMLKFVSPLMTVGYTSPTALLISADVLLTPWIGCFDSHPLNHHWINVESLFKSSSWSYSNDFWSLNFHVVGCIPVVAGFVPYFGQKFRSVQEDHPESDRRAAFTEWRFAGEAHLRLRHSLVQYAPWRKPWLMSSFDKGIQPSLNPCIWNPLIQPRDLTIIWTSGVKRSFTCCNLSFDMGWQSWPWVRSFFFGGVLGLGVVVS
jgi:hypothetical protein